MKRNRRQTESNFDAEDLEAAAEEVNTRSPTTQLTQELDLQPNETRPMGQETDQTLNPDNPYNVRICSIISFQSPRLLQAGSTGDRGFVFFFLLIYTVFACSVFLWKRLVKHLLSSKQVYSWFSSNFCLKQAQVFAVASLWQIDPQVAFQGSGP